MKTRHLITGDDGPSWPCGGSPRRDALAVLTPEQRERAKSSHEKRMQEMRSSPQGPTPRGSR
jgi:hypothetical protein